MSYFQIYETTVKLRKIGKISLSYNMEIYIDSYEVQFTSYCNQDDLDEEHIYTIKSIYEIKYGY